MCHDDIVFLQKRKTICFMQTSENSSEYKTHNQFQNIAIIEADKPPIPTLVFLDRLRHASVVVPISFFFCP